MRRGFFVVFVFVLRSLVVEGRRGQHLEMSGKIIFQMKDSLRSFKGGWEGSLQEVNTQDLNGDRPGQEGLTFPGKMTDPLLSTGGDEEVGGFRGAGWQEI